LSCLKKILQGMILQFANQSQQRILETEILQGLAKKGELCF